MDKLVDGYLKTAGGVVLFLLVLFIIVGISCAYDGYNESWTIEDHHFKIIYEDYHECFIENMGTNTTEICDDKNQVIYKNK